MNFTAFYFKSHCLPRFNQYLFAMCLNSSNFETNLKAMYIFNHNVKDEGTTKEMHF